MLLHQMGAWASNEDEPPDLRRLRLIRALERGRFIVLLDNVADSRSVLPLLPRGDASKTIITTRRMLATLARERGAGHVEVGLLTAAEAARLFTALVGRERVDAEPEAARRLLAACANLPLAVSIAGSQVAQPPGQSLEQIAAGLTAAEERLDFFDLGEPESSIKSVLSWSYTSLTEEQRRTYLLLGTAPGPDLDVAAAEALLDTSQARGLLRGLRWLALAEENSDGGFAMHDVLRDFASSLVGAGHLARETIREAHGRLLHHYARILRNAKTRESLLESNIDRALTTARHCAKGPQQDIVRAIAEELIDPLWHRGRFSDAISLLRSVIDGFGDSTVPAVHAYFLRLLAITLRHAGEPEESEILARAALRILDEAPSTSSARASADCHYLIGIAEAAQEDHASALDHFHQALAGFTTSGVESDLGDVLNAIGWSLAMTGEHERGLERCLQAAAVHERVGPPRSLAADLDSIGYIRRSRGEHRSAMDCFERCLAIYREVGHRPHEARTLEELGDTAAISSDPSTASLYWTQAAALLKEIGLDAARVHVKLEGNG
jgi:tetratricopeptide (TPR) repeat protein